MKNQNWDYKYIDGQLKYRLSAITKITIENNHPHSKGNFTQFYIFNGQTIMKYNRKPDGELIGNFVISGLVDNEPRGAIEFEGRTGKGTFGKRLVIDKCGDNDLEKFNYISELLYQVIQKIESNF